MPLAQETYLDENGRPISANLVDNIATYRRMSDGFFQWTCENCRHTATNRSFELPQGSVYRCDGCEHLNLLLSSSTDYIRQALSFWEANKPQVMNGRFDQGNTFIEQLKKDEGGEG